MLSTIIVIVVVIALFIALRGKFSGVNNENVKNITSEEANDLIKKNKELIILDVRTKGEYQSGHIPGAKLMPVGNIGSRMGELEKYRGRPMLVYCASGHRSPMAVKTLLKNNFTNIYNLKSGLNTWNFKLSK